MPDTPEIREQIGRDLYLRILEPMAAAHIRGLRQDAADQGFDAAQVDTALTVFTERTAAAAPEDWRDDVRELVRRVISRALS